MTAVEFITWYGPYQKGVVASFADEDAQRLIKGGKAKKWDDPTQKAAPKKAMAVEEMVKKAL